jgi:rod shape-determining protein MreC
MFSAPPPFFRQGPSARMRMLFFAVISIALILVDTRLRSLETVRKSFSVVLYPLQKATLLPRDMAGSMASYFSSVRVLRRENERLRVQAAQQAADSLRNQALAAENQHLKNLLHAKQIAPVPSLLAEVLYDARDPFSRKVLLDRGSQDGVKPGQPVIDDLGVIGQITRAFPLTSELTLLTDRDQTIPVQILRTGSRSVAYGAEVDMLELRFMAANADVQDGDILTTSGIDGVYPPGFPVARVTSVERKAGNAFARILCTPIAGVNRNKHVLVLLANPAPPAAKPVDAPLVKKLPRKESGK